MLGCKLFVKEISSKARDQLLTTNQMLVEGDFITKINNTNCNDMMSLKEAKKIIDGTKDKLTLTVARDTTTTTNNISHQTQSSLSTTGAVNNFYKGNNNKIIITLQNKQDNLFRRWFPHVWTKLLKSEFVCATPHTQQQSEQLERFWWATTTTTTESGGCEQWTEFVAGRQK